MKEGLTARFDYRYLLLNDLMNPKSAGPFILDAHSFWIGSSVLSARGVNFSGWLRTYAITASRFSLGVLGLPRTFLT